MLVELMVVNIIAKRYAFSRVPAQLREEVRQELIRRDHEDLAK